MQSIEGVRAAESGFISDNSWRQKETLERAHLLFLPSGKEEMSHNSAFGFNSDIMNPAKASPWAAKPYPPLGGRLGQAKSA